jgi:hypothetical protein
MDPLRDIVDFTTTHRKIPEGLRVEAYWNLHKRCYSVRALENWSDWIKKGRVIAWAFYLELDDVKFVVQPAGRERVRREGKKNVHAFIRGKYGSSTGYIKKSDDWDRVVAEHAPHITYNPFKHETFVTVGKQEPIYVATKVQLDTLIDDGRMSPLVYTLKE